MKVSSINKYINPKTTGYTATVAMGLTICSGLTKNKAVRKAHKPFSYISLALVALHIGLIEYYNHKYKNKSNKEILESLN